MGSRQDLAGALEQIGYPAILAAGGMTAMDEQSSEARRILAGSRMLAESVLEEFC